MKKTLLIVGLITLSTTTHAQLGKKLNNKLNQASASSGSGIDTTMYPLPTTLPSKPSETFKADQWNLSGVYYLWMPGKDPKFKNLETVVVEYTPNADGGGFALKTGEAAGGMGYHEEPINAVRDAHKPFWLNNGSGLFEDGWVLNNGVIFYADCWNDNGSGQWSVDPNRFKEVVILAKDPEQLNQYREPLKLMFTRNKAREVFNHANDANHLATAKVPAQSNAAVGQDANLKKTALDGAQKRLNVSNPGEKMIYVYPNSADWYGEQVNPLKQYYDFIGVGQRPDGSYYYFTCTVERDRASLTDAWQTPYFFGFSISEDVKKEEALKYKK